VQVESHVYGDKDLSTSGGEDLKDGMKKDEMKK